MSVLISDIDSAKLCVQFFYESLKTKEKSSWVIPKVVAVAYGSGRLRELSLQSLKF